jgi:alpha-beta hydrolase superfamily lysophospholipase
MLANWGRWFFPRTPIETGPDGFEGTRYPQKWIEGYEKSGLGHAKITPLLFASAREMRVVVHEIERWPARLPMLFMQGGNDGSVSVERNMKWIDAVRERNPERIEVVWHQEAEHAMLRTDKPTVLLNKVISFVQRCIGMR